MSEEKHTPIFLAIKTALAKRDEDAVRGVGDWQKGMFCGLEDRNITDRYDACEYGYEKALDRVDEWILDGLDDLIDQACKSHDQDQETIKALVNACEIYFEAKAVFDKLDPKNPDCGPEVLCYSIAKTRLKAALALAKKD